MQPYFWGWGILWVWHDWFFCPLHCWMLCVLPSSHLPGDLCPFSCLLFSFQTALPKQLSRFLLQRGRSPRCPSAQMPTSPCLPPLAQGAAVQTSHRWYSGCCHPPGTAGLSSPGTAPSALCRLPREEAAPCRALPGHFQALSLQQSQSWDGETPVCVGTASGTAIPAHGEAPRWGLAVCPSGHPTAAACKPSPSVVCAFCQAHYKSF